MGLSPQNGALTDEQPKKGSLLVGIAKVAFAAFLIYYLVRRGDIEPGQLRDALRHWVLTLIVILLTVLSYMGQGFRWDVILRDRKISVPYLQALRYLMIGKFFNLAIPGYFSEDFVRGLYLVRINAASKSKVFMSLMADRFVGIVSLFLVCASGLMVRSFVNGGASDARLALMRTLTIVVTLGVACAVLLIRRFPRPPEFLRVVADRLRLLRIFDSVYAELHYYCDTLHLQAKLVGISLVNHSLMVFCFVVFGYALGMTNVRIADYFIFVPLGILVTMIPLAPVGLGVGHFAFLNLFKIAGSPEGANLFSLYTAVCILVNLSGGLFYLGLGKPAENARPAMV